MQKKKQQQASGNIPTRSASGTLKYEGFFHRLREAIQEEMKYETSEETDNLADQGLTTCYGDSTNNNPEDITDTEDDDEDDDDDADSIDADEHGFNGDSDEDDSWLEQLWPLRRGIRAKFGNVALTDAEWRCGDRMKPVFYQGLFYLRLCSMLGISIANEPHIFQELNQHHRNGLPVKFQFMEPHLVDFHVKVKHMHLIASCEGKALFMKSASLLDEKIILTDEELKRCQLLLSFAKEKLEFALKSITDSVKTLLNLAKINYLLGLYCEKQESAASGSLGQSQDSQHTSDKQKKYFDASVKHYEQAINILIARERSAKIRQKQPSKDSDHSIRPVLLQQEREEGTQLQCTAMLSLAAVLCEVSLLGLDPNSAEKQLCFTDQAIAHRRRTWGSVWDLIQVFLLLFSFSSLFSALSSLPYIQ